MKIPHELEDEYVKNVLYNYSLDNLPNEQWKPIEGFENYQISNYGRTEYIMLPGEEILVIGDTVTFVNLRESLPISELLINWIPH